MAAPWKLKASSQTTEYEILTPRNYDAILEEIEQRSAQQWDEKKSVMRDSPYLMFKFALTEPEYEGRFVWANAGLREDGTIPGTWQGRKAKARVFIEGLLGRELEDEEELDPQDILGKACEIGVVIVAGKDGEKRNTVQSVSPPRGAPAVTTAPARSPSSNTQTAPAVDPSVANLREYASLVAKIKKAGFKQEQIDTAVATSTGAAEPFKALTGIEQDLALEFLRTVAEKPGEFDENMEPKF